MSDAGLPGGWIWSRVGDIADYINGLAFKPSDWEGVGRPIIRIQNLTSKKARYNHTTREVDERFIVRPGMILVSWSATLDAFVWHGPEAVLNQHIFKVVPRDAMPDRRYVRWGLKNAIEELWASEHTHGTTMKHVNRGPFLAHRFPLAPAPEQERISDALESHFSRLDAAVEGLERVQANLKRYRASVLKTAVEGRLVPTEAELAKQEGRDYEPASVLLERILEERRHRWEQAELAKLKAKGNSPPKDNKWKRKYEEPPAADPNELPELPRGWCWATLEQLTSSTRIICYGILMPKEHVPDGVLYVKVRDMRGGVLNPAALQRTRREIAAKYPRSVLQTGDLLIAIRGTYGRVVDVPAELEGGNITQDSARLDLAPGIDRRYAKWCLLSPAPQNYFKRVARGVAVKGVNIGDLRTTPIPLPPTREQERIAAEVEDLLSLEEAALSAVANNAVRVGRLRQSILKWAFEGKLVDQDPNDEPASVLLERIRAEREATASAKKPSIPRKKK